MIEKKVYCPPLTDRLEVVLESGICAASLVEDENDSAEIVDQEDAGDFKYDTWD